MKRPPRRVRKTTRRKPRPRELRESAQLGVGDLIARLLPRGSRDDRPDRILSWREAPSAWAECPVWPPDLFAVAATLVQKSGSYAYFGRRTAVNRFGESYARTVADLGLAWRKNLEPPAEVQKWWTQLLDYRDATINPVEEGDEPAGRREKWWEHSLWLMAVADEASVYLGFTVGEDAGTREEMRFASLVVTEAATLLKKVKQPPSMLKQLPASLCWLVPRSECCVLPKCRTPQVGMTLPRFSHHLALLPSAAEVQPRWILNPLDTERVPDRGAYRRLLLVPFPYRILDEDFRPSALAGAVPGTGIFEVEQGWLSRGATPARFADFVTGLLREARREAKEVHGVVLPELALDSRYFEALRQRLAAMRDIQLLITGFWGPRPGVDRGPLANQVRSVLFLGQDDLIPLSQAKHHRWKLDGGQIERYLLEDSLDPKTTWEERTAIEQRECLFFLGPTGASIATLVCEDLARAEPVQPILRAVGPNLVVAILMDGPQLEQRWPGKYATVLAEDPGSSVLTFTSQGLVRRSLIPGKPERREVALWKEAGGKTQELELPLNSHAILLTLRLGREKALTLDGRAESAVKVSFKEARGIAHPQPPKWLDS